MLCPGVGDLAQVVASASPLSLIPTTSPTKSKLFPKMFGVLQKRKTQKLTVFKVTQLLSGREDWVYFPVRISNFAS